MITQSNTVLTDKEFERIREFVYNFCGISLSPVKKTMVQSRLNKKLTQHKFNSYSQYIDYVFSHQESQDEIIELIDIITTNKTDFFREAHHFTFLKEKVLPEFYKENEGSEFKIWSAGCSSGMEPYTMAMFLENFKELNKNFKYSIFASDISTKILREAHLAIYKEEDVDVVPMDFKKKFLLKSKNRADRKVRIAPHLRKKVEFKRINFMDNDYGISTKFDAIFCRNVLIYFDLPTRQSILTKLCNRLKHKGNMFLGHSESIVNLNLPLTQINPSVFIKDR